jgi:hypothetical protein
MKAAAADKGTTRQSTVPVSAPYASTPRSFSVCVAKEGGDAVANGQGLTEREAHHITYQGTAQRRT